LFLGHVKAQSESFPKSVGIGFLVGTSPFKKQEESAKRCHFQFSSIEAEKLRHPQSRSFCGYHVNQGMLKMTKSYSKKSEINGLGRIRKERLRVLDDCCRPPESDAEVPTEESSENTTEEERRNAVVCFADVEIIEFQYAIGHNPGVSKGVPLTLGARPVRMVQMSLDEYDNSRRGRRRHGPSLVLHRDMREKM